MSFHDLPEDWPHRSLEDPLVAADVADLCVSEADRSGGCLALLLCRTDGTLAQPVTIETHGCPDVPALLEQFVDLTPELPGVGGLVVVIGRPWGGPTSSDAAVHRRALEVCRTKGLTLWGTYLATSVGVSALPPTLFGTPLPAA